QDPSRTAAIAKRLTGKALAPLSDLDILRSRTSVFPRNRREAVVRCGLRERLVFRQNCCSIYMATDDSVRVASLQEVLYASM
ncbi:hypothetical protein, partial [Salipiger abyssi]|uniref:hypothetical protein n=1 Tax=Salipiger abyssi TaxID=1250539 RepID=UPI001A8E2B80